MLRFITVIYAIQFQNKPEKQIFSPAFQKGGSWIKLTKVFSLGRHVHVFAKLKFRVALFSILMTLLPVSPLLPVEDTPVLLKRQQPE